MRPRCGGCSSAPAPTSSTSRRCPFRPWFPPVSSAACARGGASEEHLALARVARERCRALELRAGFFEAAQLIQKVAPDARQKMVALEGPLRPERVHQLETRPG